MAWLCPRTLGYALLACAVLLGTPSALHADDAEARYQTTVEQAVREFGLNNWAEARALFRRAHALSPSARTWRGMGMAAYELKMYVEALRELTAALVDANRSLTEEQRGQVQSLIDQSRAYVGRYHVVLEPSTARPRVDGQEALFDPGNVLLLSLGDHELTATAEGYQNLRLPLRVEGGEDSTLQLTLVTATAAPTALASAAAPAPLPPPAPTDGTAVKPQAAADGGSTATTVGWIAAASAVAFAGGAAAFWFIGEGKYSDLEKQCGSSCSNAQIDASGVQTTDLLHQVFVAVAGAAAVTSVIGFVIGASSGGDDVAADGGMAARVRLGPTSLQIEGSF